MQRLTKRARIPNAWQAGRDSGHTVGVISTHQYSTLTEPVALEVWKRGRPCIVGKLTFLDNEPILAVAHRNQHGVKATISVPLVALDYAEQHGCRWLFFRRDQTAQMWRISLADLRKRGWLQSSDGLPEVFIRIDAMQPCAWRKWQFADQVVRLETEPERPAAQQLGLFPGVAP